MFIHSVIHRIIITIFTILEPLHLDLVLFQEIQNNEKWLRFSQRLSLHYFNFDGGCKDEHFGNVIASHYPIQSSLSHRASFSCPGQKKSLLQCSLDGNHPFIQNRLFVVTHLHYLDEDDRLKRMKQFKRHELNIDILMDDINALTREDYSNHYHRHIWS